MKNRETIGHLLFLGFLILIIGIMTTDRKD